MTLKRAGLLMIVSLCVGTQAHALSCSDPGDLMVAPDEEPPTRSEILRLRSISIANARKGEDIIVVGQFSRNSPVPFLHDEQFDDITAMLGFDHSDVQRPHWIEFSYPWAYSFDGHKVDDARLVPFSSDAIGARVTISAEYEGIVDQLPAASSDVIGVLRSQYGGRSFELTTDSCPTYDPADPAQVSDLLTCYREGECQ